MAGYKCQKCGAEVGFSDYCCPKCGALTKYGETHVRNERQGQSAVRGSRVVLSVYMALTWFFVIFVPPVGFFMSCRGMIGGIVTRFRGTWGYVLGVIISFFWTAAIIVFICLLATGVIKFS